MLILILVSSPLLLDSILAFTVYTLSAFGYTLTRTTSGINAINNLSWASSYISIIAMGTEYITLALMAGRGEKHHMREKGNDAMLEDGSSSLH